MVDDNRSIPIRAQSEKADRSAESPPDPPDSGPPLGDDAQSYTGQSYTGNGTAKAQQRIESQQTKPWRPVWWSWPTKLFKVGVAVLKMTFGSTTSHKGPTYAKGSVTSERVTLQKQAPVAGSPPAGQVQAYARPVKVTNTAFTVAVPSAPIRRAGSRQSRRYTAGPGGQPPRGRTR